MIALGQVMTVEVATARVDKHGAAVGGRPSGAPPTFCRHLPPFDASASAVRSKLAEHFAPATPEASTISDVAFMPALGLDSFRPIWCPRAVALQPLQQERERMRGLGPHQQAQSLKNAALFKKELGFVVDMVVCDLSGGD